MMPASLAAAPPIEALPNITMQMVHPADIRTPTLFFQTIDRQP